MVENIQMASELRLGEIGIIIVFVKSLSLRLTSGNFPRLVVRRGDIDNDDDDNDDISRVRGET